MPRLIAFYLPQFHPIPENDAWWGRGFTEWTNVTRAKPLFPGHLQPQLPADLGFYDLRVPEVRAGQADLARGAGIEGFCYWHYWFGGRRILERPFNEVISSGEPDFPLCLGWANESWQGIWHGCERRLLIEQTFPGKADHEAHFYALLDAFHDRRYLRVRGKPIFVIFRPNNLPNPEGFLELWQNLARENGLAGIHFVAHLFDNEENYPFRSIGYEGAVMTSALKVVNHRIWHVAAKHAAGFRNSKGPMQKLERALQGSKSMIRVISRRVAQRIMNWPGSVHDYADARMFFDPERAVANEMYPSVVPRWDNSPRAGKKGVVLHASTPELFEQHFREVLSSVAHRSTEDNIVFVKSWNEWAEGNYLEPDQKFGHGYLHAMKSALEATPSIQPAWDTSPA